MNNPQQLLPGFTINSNACFNNFYASGTLQLVKKSLADYLGQPASGFVYLCGVAGTGKSHLLQAMCNAALDSGMTALYLPLGQLQAYAPQDILDNTNTMDLLCIDDLDVIAGDQAWEAALFHLYNQRLMAGKHLLLAASKTPGELALQLPDLRTRLTACLVFQLALLSDAEKASLIQFRAALTGMDINDACIQYVVQRSGRNLSDLVAVLERLDKESLVAGRKITVPFIKSVFHW